MDFIGSSRFPTENLAHRPVRHSSQIITYYYIVLDWYTACIYSTIYKLILCSVPHNVDGTAKRLKLEWLHTYCKSKNPSNSIWTQTSEALIGVQTKAYCGQSALNYNSFLFFSLSKTFARHIESPSESSSREVNVNLRPSCLFKKDSSLCAIWRQCLNVHWAASSEDHWQDDNIVTEAAAAVDCGETSSVHTESER